MEPGSYFRSRNVSPAKRYKYVIDDLAPNSNLVELEIIIVGDETSHVLLLALDPPDRTRNMAYFRLI